MSEIEHRDHWQQPGWVEGTFEKHLELTRQGMAQAAGHPAIVVWPETASAYWLQQDKAAREAVAQAAKPALATLAGTAREEAPGIDHNSLVVVMPDASVGGRVQQVPFGAVRRILPQLPADSPGRARLEPRAGLRTLHVPGLPPIGPLICYEAIFPAQVVVQGDRPAFLVNITNDSWFGDLAGPRQHLAAARMRTVEEGLPMVRAANTGISAVITSHGDVVAKLGLNRSGTVVAEIPGNLPPTLFSRLGLAAPASLSLISCVMALFLSKMRGAGNFMS